MYMYDLGVIGVSTKYSVGEQSQLAANEMSLC